MSDEERRFSNVLEELRAKRPKMAERAKKSRAMAIRLNCLECMGGNSAEVNRCTRTLCALYPFRRGRLEKDGEGVEEEGTSGDEGEDWDL